jgi:hypothetical protein
VTAADRALVRSEPRLPGLAALFDDAAFTELLATWLPGAGIRCARATYVRYKPGTSCLVSYRVGTAAGKRIVHARAERDDAAGGGGGGRARAPPHGEVRKPLPAA